jgi:glyoxylase-like metal-dependent hydrolase (beta-lactamase superfamily II)
VTSDPPEPRPEVSSQVPSELPPGYEPPAGLFDRWREIGPGVLVRRHRVLDLNVTLVLGGERALVVDTQAHGDLARALVAAIRQVTPLPWVVVNTHAHFDHTFGNAVLAAEQAGLEIWAHVGCRTELERHGERQRRLAAGWFRDAGLEGDARAVLDVEILPPNRTFDADVELELGGRVVAVHHPGRGHTDHDAVVDVPDAGVTIVGDLVEEGTPPSFGDAYPLDWPATLTGLLPRLRPVVVPGHGDVVGPAFVAAQRDDLAAVADTARALPGQVGETDLLRAAARLPIGRRAGLDALRRSLALRVPRQG